MPNVAAVGTEEADKRSWATLPDRIQVGRVVVPPGTYDIELRWRGRAGEEVAKQPLRRVALKAGEKRFISTREMQ